MIWQQSPDHKAATIIIASLLYYSFDLSMMPDAEFDELCQEVAKDWKHLDPLRRWQLGSAEEIKASGFAAKTTQLTLSWAITEAERLKGTRRFRVYHSIPWRFSKRHSVHWLGVSHFSLKDLPS
jgi:hypothetical protein